ncbi:MAG: sigma-54 dependent DNA-binding response regulator [Candidatus Rifleibacterium amylolyticum]|nr:MAG: sigma-54 dependent DNA-binding response regulator [Candidatus Rifleibacterium amylolyticum]
MLQILIVDDEPNIRKTLSYCLSAEGHGVTAVNSLSEAILESSRQSFDMAFVDLKLGNENGMDLIPILLSHSSRVKIVVITAHATIESAVEAMRKGACDYITKPFTPEQVRLITRQIAKIRELETEIDTLKESMQQLEPENLFQSKSVSMQRLIETARKAADSEAIILLQGESGTGKSILAKAIHQWSKRAGKPMATVNCPAVPSELLESELFGHAKGAFTGAVKDNPGRIAACEGGTLFLDEIGDMALALQAKLLRFIQEKEYERLGEAKLRKADVRILAASNIDLSERVSSGNFREDLFYRLNVITLKIPPLRERKEDIMALATSFLAYFCQVNHKTISGFSSATESLLADYGWPGNVRELRNCIERAVILGCNPLIEIADLPGNILPVAENTRSGDLLSLARIEELHIRKVLAQTPSLQQAAEILGIDQATLWRKRKTFGL